MKHTFGGIGKFFPHSEKRGKSEIGGNASLALGMDAPGYNMTTFSIP